MRDALKYVDHVVVRDLKCDLNFFRRLIESILKIHVFQTKDFKCVTNITK
jgi:hypothetical protein